jgi:hypothetical protein
MQLKWRFLKSLPYGIIICKYFAIKLAEFGDLYKSFFYLKTTI